MEGHLWWRGKYLDVDELAEGGVEREAVHAVAEGHHQVSGTAHNTHKAHTRLSVSHISLGM